jgi:hypothetical protein
LNWVALRITLRCGVSSINRIDYALNLLVKTGSHDCALASGILLEHLYLACTEAEHLLHFNQLLESKTLHEVSLLVSQLLRGLLLRGGCRHTARLLHGAFGSVRHVRCGSLSRFLELVLRVFWDGKLGVIWGIVYLLLALLSRILNLSRCLVLVVHGVNGLNQILHQLGRVLLPHMLLLLSLALPITCHHFQRWLLHGRL